MTPENEREMDMRPTQWVEEKLSNDDRANALKELTLREAAVLEEFASYPHSPLEMKVDWPSFYEWVMGDGS